MDDPKLKRHAAPRNQDAFADLAIRQPPDADGGTGDDPFADLALAQQPKDAARVTVPVLANGETPAQHRQRMSRVVALGRVRDAQANEEGLIRTALRAYSEGATRVASNLAEYGGRLGAAFSTPQAPNGAALVVPNLSRPTSKLAAYLARSADAIAPTAETMGGGDSPLAQALAGTVGGTAGEFSASQAAFGSASNAIASPLTRGVAALAERAAAGQLPRAAQATVGPLLARLAPQLGPAVPSVGREVAKAAVRALPGELVAGATTATASGPLEQVTDARNVGFTALAALVAGAGSARGARAVGYDAPITREETLVRALEGMADRLAPSGVEARAVRRPALPRYGEPVSTERAAVAGDASAVDVVPFSRVQRDLLRERDAERFGVAQVGPARRRTAADQQALADALVARRAAIEAEGGGKAPAPVLGPREPVPAIGEPVSAEGVGPLQRVTTQSEALRQALVDAFRAREAERLGVPREAIGPARRRPAGALAGRLADATDNAGLTPVRVRADVQPDALPDVPAARVPEAERVPAIGDAVSYGGTEGRIPTVANVRRVQGMDGPPVEGEVPAPARAPNLRVRPEFRAKRTPELLTALSEEQARLESEQTRAGGSHWLRKDAHGETYSGQSFSGGKAQRQAQMTARRILELEHELRARGIGDETLADVRLRGSEEGMERLPFDEDPEASADPWDFPTDDAPAAPVREPMPPQTPPDAEAPDDSRHDPGQRGVAVAETTTRPAMGPESAAQRAKSDNAYAALGAFGSDASPLDRAVDTRLRDAVARLRAEGAVDKGAMTFEQQRQAAREYAKQLVADPLAIDQAKVAKLDGYQVRGMMEVVNENTALLEATSRAINSGTLSGAELDEAFGVVQRLEADTDALLAKVITEKAQTARSLGFFRDIAKRTTDPDVWLVKAKQVLGDAPMTDAVMTEIRRLARAAADACGGT